MKVERGIPAPPAFRGGRPPIYPFAQMRIGGSFAVSIQKGETPEAVARRVRAAAATWRSRNLAPVSFRVRVVVENERPVVRCWMLAP